MVTQYQYHVLVSPFLPVLGERGRSGVGTRTEEYKENDATFGSNGIDRLVVEMDCFGACDNGCLNKVFPSRVLLKNVCNKS